MSKLFLVGLIVACFSAPAEKITIWLIGDSTMSKKEIKAYPETGWGMPFSDFWDSTVVVENMAKNGRSSKSFMAENLWVPVVDKLKEGDYVFIQFGHNDESKDKGERYSTPEEYRQNLKKYIHDTRSRKAIPVLITSAARRKFDEAGRIKLSHGEYPPIVRDLAKSENVILLELEGKSMTLIESWGPENSKLLFNYLKAGQHPNYPEGKKDDTHFNELGASKMASIILQEIRLKIPGLATRIITKTAKSS